MITKEQKQRAHRQGEAFAVCCSQPGMVGTNGQDDRVELTAAYAAGFAAGMEYAKALLEGWPS